MARWLTCQDRAWHLEYIFILFSKFRKQRLGTLDNFPKFSKACSLSVRKGFMSYEVGSSESTNSFRPIFHPLVSFSLLISLDLVHFAHILINHSFYNYFSIVRSGCSTCVCQSFNTWTWIMTQTLSTDYHSHPLSSLPSDTSHVWLEFMCRFRCACVLQLGLYRDQSFTGRSVNWSGEGILVGSWSDYMGVSAQVKPESSPHQWAPPLVALWSNSSSGWFGLSDLTF